MILSLAMYEKYDLICIFVLKYKKGETEQKGNQYK